MRLICKHCRWISFRRQELRAGFNETDLRNGLGMLVRHFPGRQGAGGSCPRCGAPIEPVVEGLEQ